MKPGPARGIEPPAATEAANRAVPEDESQAGEPPAIVDGHIIPQTMTDGLLINVADCTLYLFQKGQAVSVLPVVLGRTKSGRNRSWQTPLGSFKVTGKVRNPTWHVPTSIQKEMEEQGQEVLAAIPPGPENPLGRFAIRTSLPGILIHGTNVPSLKKGYGSHGCIRVPGNKIASLFAAVKINTTGEIVYRPIKIAVEEDGRVFLEVHRDSYGKMTDMENTAQELIAEQQLESSVDWDKVTRILEEKSGFAEDVSF